MDFIEKVIGDSIFVVWYNGKVASVLAKKTASEAMDILGRELYPWEEFYWIVRIENNSWIRWAGSDLLKYLTSISYHGNRTYGVHARPIRGSIWRTQDLGYVISWLRNWYSRHGFVYPNSIKDAQILIYKSWVARNYVRLKNTREFDTACWF
jgi:hypothetical protein